MKKTVLMLAMMTVATAAMASDRNYVAPKTDASHQAARQGSDRALAAAAQDNAFILGHQAPRHSSK